MGCGASRDLKIGHSVNESADLSSLPSSTSSGLLQESDKGSDGVFAEGSVVDSICEDRFQEFHDDEHISPKNSASHVSFWSKIQSSIQRAPSSITEEKTRQPATSTSSSLHGGQRLSRHTERKRVNEVDRPKVSPENAYSGMLVTLDIEGFSMSGLARFPGDTGPVCRST